MSALPDPSSSPGARRSNGARRGTVKAAQFAEARRESQAMSFTLPFVDNGDLREMLEQLCPRYIEPRWCKRLGAVRSIAWYLPRSGYTVTQQMVNDFCAVHDLTIARSSDVTTMPTVTQMTDATESVRRALRCGLRLAVVIRRFAVQLRVLRNAMKRALLTRRERIRAAMVVWDASESAKREKIRDRIRKNMANVRHFRHQTAMQTIRSGRIRILDAAELELLSAVPVPAERRHAVVKEFLRRAYLDYHVRFVHWRRANEAKAAAVLRYARENLVSVIALPELHRRYDVAPLPLYSFTPDAKALQALLEEREAALETAAREQRRVQHILLAEAKLRALGLIRDDPPPQTDVVSAAESPQTVELSAGEGASSSVLSPTLFPTACRPSTTTHGCRTVRVEAIWRPPPHRPSTVPDRSMLLAHALRASVADSAAPEEEDPTLLRNRQRFSGLSGTVCARRARTFLNDFQQKEVAAEELRRRMQNPPKRLLGQPIFSLTQILTPPAMASHEADEPGIASMSLTARSVPTSAGLFPTLTPRRDGRAVTASSILGQAQQQRFSPVAAPVTRLSLMATHHIAPVKSPQPPSPGAKRHQRRRSPPMFAPGQRRTGHL
jgi:hypothetical protein